MCITANTIKKVCLPPFVFSKQPCVYTCDVTFVPVQENAEDEDEANVELDNPANTSPREAAGFDDAQPSTSRQGVDVTPSTSGEQRSSPPAPRANRPASERRGGTVSTSSATDARAQWAGAPENVIESEQAASVNNETISGESERALVNERSCLVVNSDSLSAVGRASENLSGDIVRDHELEIL